MSQKKNKPSTHHRPHSAQSTTQNVRLVQNNKPSSPSLAQPKPAATQAAQVAVPAEKATQKAVEKTVATAQKATATAEKVTATAEKTAQKVASEATKSFAKSSAQVEKSLEKSLDTLKDITENQQIRWEALAESCKVAADVQQELNAKVQKELNALVKEQVELTKKFFGCRQVNDFVELHNQALKCHINHSIDLTARMAEAWFKLATDAVEPIENARHKARNIWKV